jgi:hypothetical protein
MLIESYSRPGTPLWFREGLVLYLSEPDAEVRTGTPSQNLAGLEKAITDPGSEQQLRGAYAEARAHVAQLAGKYGKAELIKWVQNGLPAGL